MRELKITAGFMLSIFGLGIALAVGGPIYRSRASMAVFGVIVGVCVVCTVAGLMLLESAGGKEKVKSKKEKVFRIANCGFRIAK